MSSENLNNPNPLDIDPEVTKLMGDLDQAMQSGDWTIEQAEQAVAESEWGKAANETDMVALRDLLNIGREPNVAVADAGDIIEQELGKVVDEEVREKIATVAEFLLNRLADRGSKGFTDRLAAYRQEAQKKRLESPAWNDKRSARGLGGYRATRGHYRRAHERRQPQENQPPEEPQQ